jgi:hypothetical protein
LVLYIGCAVFFRRVGSFQCTGIGFGHRFNGSEHGEQGLADGDQAVDVGDPRRAAIGQDGLGPLAQIVTSLADALAQLTDLGAALLDGTGLQFQRLGFGLHLGKAFDKRCEVDTCGPDHDPVLPVASALAVDPGIADDEASLLQLRSAELIERGVRPKASAKRQACVQTAQIGQTDSRHPWS